MNDKESYLVRAQVWIDETADLAVEQLEAVIEQFSCRLLNLKKSQPNNMEEIKDLELTIEYLNDCAVNIGGENTKTEKEVRGVTEAVTESQSYSFDPSSLVNYSVVEKVSPVRNVSVIQELIRQGVVRRGYR